MESTNQCETKQTGLDFDSPTMTTDAMKAYPFIETDLGQPDLRHYRYNDRLPRRRVKGEIGFDEWIENWTKEFTRLHFNFNGRQHLFQVANAFNLAEMSREALNYQAAQDITNLFLGSEEIEVGLRLAVDRTSAWVPTGDLMSARAPETYVPRRMFSRDRESLDKHQFLVLPVHGGCLQHWGLVIYDHRAKMANLCKFLECNGMDNKHVTFTQASIPDQSMLMSCGWIAIESARAFMHEDGLQNWSESTLYQEIARDGDTELEAKRELALIKNWASWAAIPWRGTHEFLYPSPDHEKITMPKAHTEALPKAQPKVTKDTPSQSANVTSADEDDKRRLLSEMEAANIPENNRLILVYFIREIQGQLLRPLTVLDYYFYYLGYRGNISQATEMILKRHSGN
ncbi:hypothetical protein F4804DRAFT_350672 [Jackrogersella minutella]|nr:hypothetical protein F4804DRAFT_350672 [Jackrogersella minutella]